MFDVTAMVNPWETMNKNISHYLCCMFLSYFSALILNDSWYVKVLHEKWGTTSAATSEANVHDSMMKDDKLEMRICVCLDWIRH